jgi:hypothetical protein
MVEVGRHGAFSVNGVGLSHASFPLSCSLRLADRSWIVDGTAFYCTARYSRTM